MSVPYPSFPKNLGFTVDQGFAMDRSVLIWFSRKGAHPLGSDLNAYRIYTQFQKFPNDKLTLVSNFPDFAQKDQAFLLKFCKHYNIQLINFYELPNLISALQIPDEKVQLELWEFARQELQEPDGCLAVASDCVRTLSPVAKCGIYRDHDYVNVKRPRTHSKAPLGLLLDAAFTWDQSRGGCSIDSACNSVFACDESRSAFLQIYRKHMLQNSKKAVVNIDSMLNDEDNKEHFDQKAFQDAKCHMKDKLKNSTLYAALKLRKALKQVCTEEIYEKAHKQLVLLITGPLCLQDNAISEYLGQAFSLEYRKSGLTVQNAVYSLTFQTANFFMDESDCSWLKSRNKTAKTWTAIPDKHKAPFFRFMAMLKLPSEISISSKCLAFMDIEQKRAEKNNGFLPIYSANCALLITKAKEYLEPVPYKPTSLLCSEDGAPLTPQHVRWF